MAINWGNKTQRDNQQHPNITRSSKTCQLLGVKSECHGSIMFQVHSQFLIPRDVRPSSARSLQTRSHDFWRSGLMRRRESKTTRFGGFQVENPVGTCGSFLKQEKNQQHPFLDGISTFFHYRPSILGYPHLWKPLCLDGGFNKWGIPNSWMFYFGENTIQKWMITRGSPMTQETSMSTENRINMSG